MKHYSYTAAIVVVLVLALAVTVLANGAVPGMKPAPPPAPTVQPAPVPAPMPPAGTGAGPTTSTTIATTPMRCYTSSDLVTMTVSEAWMASGQNYDTMGQFIRMLTDLSAQKRGINIPDTKEAGNEMGKLIRQKAEADPNQLLYAVIDSAVVDYAARHK